MDKTCFVACAQISALSSILDSSSSVANAKNGALNTINAVNGAVRGIGEAINITTPDDTQNPVHGAAVKCTSAEWGDVLYVLNDEGNVVISDISELTRKNTKLSGVFEYCQYCKNKKCSEEREIEDDEWKDYDELNSNGEGREKLLKNQSYMVCLTGYGIIYFDESGQYLKDFAEDFSVLNRYVNEETFEGMGWDVAAFKEKYGEEAIIELKRYMYQYGITDRFSICMFLATLGTESINGTARTEGPHSSYDSRTYIKNTSGAGLIQVTGFDQIEFLNYLKEKYPDDSLLQREIIYYMDGYPKEFPLNSKGKEQCTNTRCVTDFIAENFPIESAVWYWAVYKKIVYYDDVTDLVEDEDDDGTGMSLNEYVCNIMDHLDIEACMQRNMENYSTYEAPADGDYPTSEVLINVFFVTQCTVNGTKWSNVRRQKIAECTDNFYEIGESKLSFYVPLDEPKGGPHSEPVPNGWAERKKDWNYMEWLLFG